MVISNLDDCSYCGHEVISEMILGCFFFVEDNKIFRLFDLQCQMLFIYCFMFLKALNSVETVEERLSISCFICYEAEMSDSIATNIGDTYLDCHQISDV